ncbi:hypothetical protein H0H92_008515, partial [Tricholoma furcatifolium]
MAFALRAPQDDETGELVKDSLIPFIQSIQCVTLPPICIAVVRDRDTYGFRNLVSLDNDERDRVLESLCTNYFPLPRRTSAWNPQATNDDEDVLDPEHPIARVRRGSNVVLINLLQPFATISSPLPPSREDRKSWTAVERIKAAFSVEATDLDHFKFLITSPHHTGKGSSYVRLDTNLCQEKTLILRDSNKKLIALLATHFLLHFATFNDRLIAVLKNVFPGELFDDESNRLNYTFLALHFSYYNRYCENGTGAPKNVHPDFLCNARCQKGHHGQRCDWTSKETKKLFEQYDLLAEFLQDLFDFVRDQIAFFLPKEFQEISAYVEQLPHNQPSPAHPFGGFVVNFCVATDAHRDTKDLVSCVVIPFGHFEGGELC